MTLGNGEKCPVPFPERRRSVRMPTARRASFSARLLAGVPREGIAVELSREGLRICTRMPFPVGTLIDVELAPRDETRDSMPILVRGVVSHVTAGADREYAMGVYLRADRESRPRKFERGEIRLAMANALGRLSDSHFEETAPVALSSKEFRTFLFDPAHRARDRRRQMWAALALLALLLLAALLLAMGSPLHLSGGMALGSDSQPAAARALAASGKQDPHMGALTPWPAWNMPRRDANETDRATDASVALKDGIVSANRTGLSQGSSMTDMAPLVERPSRTDDSAAALFSERLRMASLSEDPAAFRPAIESEANASRAQRQDWVAAAASDRVRPAVAAEDRESASDDDGQAVAGPASWPIATETSDAVGQDLRLEVRKSAYQLVAYRGTTPLKTFRVGIGADDLTPTGSFTVSNKLVNPDWFHRGQIVKAGAPGNPLGKYWMGFAEKGTPTSYGIHVAVGQGWIGKSRGRGCIRIGHEDAEALFRLCPLGARVDILP